MVLSADQVEIGQAGPDSRRMKAPLIIYHTSFLPYLPFSLFQNTRTNPNRETILLGDRHNRVSGIPYTHIETEGYQEKNREFLPVYRHASPSHFGDERRCIERWFVLWDFLEKNKTKSFYFMDSDYLLFANLDDFEKNWAHGSVCGTPRIFGLGYFPDAELIGCLCRWILGLYKNGARFEATREQFRRAGSGLQEMGLIAEFCREEKVSVMDLSWRQVGTDPCFDDGFFGSSYRYTPKEFHRLRQSQAGGPVFARDGKKIQRLLGLHFGGHNKSQIPGFTGWSTAVLRSFLRPNYRRNLKWLIQYALTGSACRRQLQSKAFLA